MKISIKISFFSAKKIKKNCKKVLTLYIKSGIFIMGENNNIKKKRSTFGSQKNEKTLKKVLTLYHLFDIMYM